ncbi:MAG TPA: 3-phosphoshikimate 1-carboxyvinyltransferase [Candidatus Limnocylindrales bacterium]|nr:3-phosphoshikimate 1-carboxyvinyltransferase [Candidatus Limnocylindrales bacterium]
MSLPHLIEIVPLDKPVRAQITVPGSKSITNRALILAALAEGETTLQGALWSEDTEVMVDCLRDLGFMVNLTPDPDEPCNRTITVYGKGGVVPTGGTATQPLELFVGNAGTVARFLAAFVCLGKGVYRLHGVPRMHERPQAELFSALQQLGFDVQAENNNEKLPATISIGARSGVEPRGGQLEGAAAASCSVSIEQSSQFASALLLCARAGNWHVRVEGENSEESPYVVMTTELIKAFPKNGGIFQIEPDASSGSYFWSAEMLVPPVFSEGMEYSPAWKMDVATTLFSKISVANWPTSGWQIDQSFPDMLSWLKDPAILGVMRDPAAPEELKTQMRAIYPHPDEGISRNKDLGDSIMTAIVLAPFAGHPIRFTDLARLRLQECERVVALRTELTKCGAKVIETGDMLEVFPSQLHGAEIETYNDHRMAMCFAILGLKVPGIKIKNPACVKKTFPNFFQKLAAAPPRGLGATIRDAATNQQLAMDELFAQ